MLKRETNMETGNDNTGDGSTKGRATNVPTMCQAQLLIRAPMPKKGMTITLISMAKWKKSRICVFGSSEQELWSRIHRYSE
jgi:hypothetical protein